MVACQACGAQNPGTLEYCQHCLGALAVVHEPASLAGGGAGTGTSADVANGPADSVSPLVAATLSESLTLPNSACPRHPDMPVAGTCVRCGSFFCARCVPTVLAKNIECPNCLESKEEREAPAMVKAIIQEQWITLAMLGLLVGGMVFASIMASAKSPAASEATLLVIAVFGCVLFALPFVIAALVVGLAQRMWAVWLGFLIEAIALLWLAFGSCGITLVFLLWSLVRILKLQQLMEKYPG